MSDETWRGVIIQSIPSTPKWLPAIPSLYTMTSSADITSTLFAHGMIIGRDTRITTSTSSSTALAVWTTEGCTNPNCKDKKCSTHTTANCYWPGGGKEGQFPPNFGQKNRVNVATATNATTTAATTTTSNPSEHFVLLAQISDTSGESGIIIDDKHPIVLITKGFEKFQKGKVPTFMDSGASNTMFVSRESFNDYKPIIP